MASLKTTAAVGFGSGMLGAIVMMTVAGAAPQRGKVATRVQAKVEAREFILKDERGNEKGSWFLADGDPQLSLYDGDHNAMVSMAVTADGTSMVKLGTTKDKPNVALIVSPKGTAGASIKVPTGTITIGPGDDGRPGIEVKTTDNKVLFQTGAEPLRQAR